MTSIEVVEQFKLELPGRANREEGLERFASCLTKMSSKRYDELNEELAKRLNQQGQEVTSNA